MAVTDAMVQPALGADPTLEAAAERAFSGLAARWHAPAAETSANRTALRDSLLESVIALGFADALPSPCAREAWPDAAVIVRAQARHAVPVDMALLLATGDRRASIAEDPSAYAADGPGAAPREPRVAAALALGRGLQIGAAMQAALEMSLDYVQARKQFGRPLARFQAIQHSLAIAAEEAAATAVLADLALVQMVHEGCDAPRLASLLDATALVAGNGIEIVLDACHQVHGAIGFTREYALHRHSLDLLRWRDHLHRLRGGEIPCAERLGDAAFAAGGLWPAVTLLMKGGDSG